MRKLSIALAVLSAVPAAASGAPAKLPIRRTRASRRKPWSTGKVGMTGGSYVGIAQYLTAEQQPPHLAVITPAVAISDLYRDGYAHGDYRAHTNPQPIEPGKFYDYDIEIWPTAYELQPGHRLQLRLTSTDLPTHLPGTTYLGRDNPQDTRIELNAPAANTIRLDDSWLVVPVAGAAGAPASASPAADPKAKPKPACRRTGSRMLRLRPARRTIVEISLRRGGRPLNGRVNVRGPGIRRHVRTGATGRATIALRPQYAGTTTFSTKACGAKLRVGA